MAEKLGPPLLGHGEIAIALAKALRIPIDTDHVTGFELRVFVDEISTLKVTHYVGESQAADFSKALSTFQFEMKQTDEEVIP